MPLSVLTKRHLRQSDDSLPLTSTSRCRDQPPPTGEHTQPLRQIPRLKNNSNSNFTIGGSWLTKSNSRHSSSSSVYSSVAEPTNNSKRHYTMTTTNSEMSARSSIVSRSQQSTNSIVSSVGATSVSKSSQYSQKSAQEQRRKSDGLKEVLRLSSLRKRDTSEKNPFK